MGCRREPLHSVMSKDGNRPFRMPRLPKTHEPISELGRELQSFYLAQMSELGDAAKIGKVGYVTSYLTDMLGRNANVTQSEIEYIKRAALRFGATGICRPSRLRPFGASAFAMSFGGTSRRDKPGGPPSAFAKATAGRAGGNHIPSAQNGSGFCDMTFRRRYNCRVTAC